MKLLKFLTQIIQQEWMLNVNTNKVDQYIEYYTKILNIVEMDNKNFILNGIDARIAHMPMQKHCQHLFFYLL